MAWQSTDARVVSRRAVGCCSQEFLDEVGIANLDRRQVIDFSGERGRNRTYNLLIKSLRMTCFQ